MLYGVPVAPGRYFATSAGLTSAQDCRGKLAYRGQVGELTNDGKVPLESALRGLYAKGAA